MRLIHIVSKKFICLIFLISPNIHSYAAQSLGSGSGSYSQNFTTLGTTPITPWVDNSTILNWYAKRTGTGTACTPSNGTTASGDPFNYGSPGVADRSLGSLGSGNVAVGSFAWGILFQNNSGGANNRNSLTVSFAGEQWRYGAGGSQSVSFYYKRSNSVITDLQPNNNTTWTAVTALNFNSPISSGGASALDGNAAANRVLITNTITFSPALSDGEYIMLKWDDPDQLGTDSGFSIDDVTVSWSVAHNLPIGLSTFSGKKINNQTRLQWSTESELNNLYFDIESSRDENGFSPIGRVEGAFNSQTNSNYTFTDIHPLQGINYYRLKQVDLDGMFTYSKIISLFFDAENNVVIFPNPATNTLNVIFNKDAASQFRMDYSVANKGIEIRLFDYLGRLIKTGQVSKQYKTNFI